MHYGHPARPKKKRFACGRRKGRQHKKKYAKIKIHRNKKRNENRWKEMNGIQNQFLPYWDIFDVAHARLSFFPSYTLELFSRRCFNLCLGNRCIRELCKRCILNAILSSNGTISNFRFEGNFTFYAWIRKCHCYFHIFYPHTSVRVAAKRFVLWCHNLLCHFYCLDQMMYI